MRDVPPPRHRAWLERRPDQLIGPGHPAGDCLEAYEWTVLEERAGFLQLDVHLPERVKNPRGQLFGGVRPPRTRQLAPCARAAPRARAA